MSSRIAEEHQCPKGHGPMIFYGVDEQDIADGLEPFYECPDCGHQERESERETGMMVIAQTYQALYDGDDGQRDAAMLACRRYLAANGYWGGQ